jgi:hypothetical protein
MFSRALTTVSTVVKKKQQDPVPIMTPKIPTMPNFNVTKNVARSMSSSKQKSGLSMVFVAGSVAIASAAALIWWTSKSKSGNRRRQQLQREKLQQAYVQQTRRALANMEQLPSPSSASSCSASSASSATPVSRTSTPPTPPRPVTTPITTTPAHPAKVALPSQKHIPTTTVTPTSVTPTSVTPTSGTPTSGTPTTAPTAVTVTDGFRQAVAKHSTAKNWQKIVEANNLRLLRLLLPATRADTQHNLAVRNIHSIFQNCMLRSEYESVELLVRSLCYAGMRTDQVNAQVYKDIISEYDTAVRFAPDL